MNSTARFIVEAVLLVALPAVVTAQPVVMPAWASRVLSAGVDEARVEFSYELTDLCLPTNVRLTGAYPADQWQEGDIAELLRIAQRNIGPFDTTGSRFPFAEESLEARDFDAASYESHKVLMNSSGRAMSVECVFESDRLLYAEAQPRNADGSLAPSERLERPLSSFGTNTFTLRFIREE